MSIEANKNKLSRHKNKSLAMFGLMIVSMLMCSCAPILREPCPEEYLGNRKEGEIGEFFICTDSTFGPVWLRHTYTRPTKTPRSPIIPQPTNGSSNDNSASGNDNPALKVCSFFLRGKACELFK